MASQTHDQSTPAPDNRIRVLAIDPGRDKCGVAVVEWVAAQTHVIERRIIGPHDVAPAAIQLIAQHNIEQIIVGDSTTSQRMAENLREALPLVALVMVNEKGSTLEARTLYWQAKPPRGWRRMLPLSLQEPPEPVDDFAAVVLAQRFFAMQSK